jgi:hypothetical protein
VKRAASSLPQLCKMKLPWTSLMVGVQTILYFFKIKPTLCSDDLVQEIAQTTQSFTIRLIVL